YTIPAIFLCYSTALVVSAIFVLATPPTEIGHPGYFNHKQEQGEFAAISIILASYELVHRGWRRLVALFAICIAIWLLLASQSKAALALTLIALAGSWLMLLICKRTRLTPALIVGAVVLASMFWSNPIEKLGYRLYGDGTLTGRTEIWNFINWQISHKPWFGWGFDSYYSLPNSPQKQAPEDVRDKPSSPSGIFD